MVVKRNTKIAKILYPDNIASVTPFKVPEGEGEGIVKQSPEVLEKFISEYKIDINPKLSPEERYELMNLFYEFKDIFARDI